MVEADSAPSDEDVTDAFEVFFTPLSETYNHHMSNMRTLLRLLGSPFVTKVLDRDARPETLAAIKTRYLNPSTRTSKLGTICAAFTHSRLNANPEARDFWQSALAEADAVVEAAATNRIPSEEQRASIPDLETLRTLARALRNDRSFEDSQSKTLLTFAGGYFSPGGVDLYDVKILQDASQLENGENAIIITDVDPIVLGEADLDTAGDYVLPVDLVLQRHVTAATAGFLVRRVRGECARQVRDTIAAYPRRYLFMKTLKKRGSLPVPYTGANDWSKNVCKTLQTKSERPWTNRGLTHAAATTYVCPDPGPMETPAIVIETLAFHTGRTVIGLLESIKDGGPAARANGVPPPALSASLMVNPDDPPPVSLAAVEALHGADVDLNGFRELADAQGHGDVALSMTAVLLSLVADPIPSTALPKLGTVHVLPGPGSLPDLLDNQSAVYVGEDGGMHMRLMLASGVRVSIALGAHASKTVSTSLTHWPRAWLFGELETGGQAFKAMRKNGGFPVFVANYLTDVTGRHTSLFGLQTAMKRVEVA
jgi:hypothetical protein